VTSGVSGDWINRSQFAKSFDEELSAIGSWKFYLTDIVAMQLQQRKISALKKLPPIRSPMVSERKY